MQSSVILSSQCSKLHSNLLDLVCESGLKMIKSAKMQSRVILSLQCSKLHSNLLDLVCDSLKMIKCKNAVQSDSELADQ